MIDFRRGIEGIWLWEGQWFEGNLVSWSYWNVPLGKIIAVTIDWKICRFWVVVYQTVSWFIWSILTIIDPVQLFTEICITNTLFPQFRERTYNFYTISENSYSRESPVKTFSDQKEEKKKKEKERKFKTNNWIKREQWEDVISIVLRNKVTLSIANSIETFHCDLLSCSDCQFPNDREMQNSERIERLFFTVRRDTESLHGRTEMWEFRDTLPSLDPG